MGLFSAIGSVVKGVASTIGSACRAVGSALSGAVKAIGSGVSAAIGICGKIGGALASAVAIVGNTIGVWIPLVTAVINLVCKLLDVFKPEDNAEELGQAAVQVEKKPEDFNSVEEYISHLREEIRSGRVNIKKTEEMDHEERAKYQTIGTAIGMMGINEKYGIGIKDATEFVYETMNRGFGAKEIAAVIDKYKNGSIKDVTDYLEGREISSGAAKSSVSDNIKEAIGQASPTLNMEERTRRFNEILAERDRLNKDLKAELEKRNEA